MEQMGLTQQTPFPDQDELKNALRILKKMKKMKKMDDEQKDVFERELLWKYCDKKAENANDFGKLKGVLETVLDNDN